MKNSFEMPPGSSSSAQELPEKFKEDRISLLEWMLDYELQAAARYRRFASLVMLSPGEDHDKITTLLKESMRRSDVCFDLQESLAILMGETDTTGAMVAVDRFKSLCKNGTDLRFAIVSYPVDGRAASELLWTVHRRLDKAKKKRRGAVVASE